MGKSKAQHLCLPEPGLHLKCYLTWEGFMPSKSTRINMYLLQ